MFLLSIVRSAHSSTQQTLHHKISIELDFRCICAFDFSWNALHNNSDDYEKLIKKASLFSFNVDFPVFLHDLSTSVFS